MLKKHTLAVLIIFLSILSMSLVIKRQKNYYTTEDIIIELVGLKKYTVVKYDTRNDYNKIGISIKLKKKFFSGKNSNMTLFGGSMEPGIDGTKDKIKDFSIKFVDNTKQINITNYLISSSMYNPQEVASGITLQKFITDINNNEEYTRGISFTLGKTYFWLDKKIKPDDINHLNYQYNINDKFKKKGLID